MYFEYLTAKRGTLSISSVKDEMLHFSLNFPDGLLEVKIDTISSKKATSFCDAELEAAPQHVLNMPNQIKVEHNSKDITPHSMHHLFLVVKQESQYLQSFSITKIMVPPHVNQFRNPNLVQIRRYHRVREIQISLHRVSPAAIGVEFARRIFVCIRLTHRRYLK